MRCRSVPSLSRGGSGQKEFLLVVVTHLACSHFRWGVCISSRAGSLAHVECLSSENYFYVSCCWHPGDLEFSTAAQTPWLCALPWWRRNSHHMLHDGYTEARILCALLDRRLEVLITWEHHWKTCTWIRKTHSRGDLLSSVFGRWAAWA